MPSNIDFSQFRPDPEAFDKGQDWVNRLYQFAAKRDAGALYAQGDTAGAAKRLAVSGDIASASKLQNDEQDQQFARIKNSHDYITKQAAPLLSAIYAQHPEGLLPAFEQTVPEWKQAGATDAGVEQLRNAFKQNPKGTLEKLGGMGNLKIEKSGNDTVGLREDTGDEIWRVKGPPKPPETVTYQEGKEKVTDFYENGVKTKTVRGPISEPLIATGATGILTLRSEAAGQTAFQKPTAANNAGTNLSKTLVAAGQVASGMDGLNDEYLTQFGPDTLNQIAAMGVKHPYIDRALETKDPADIRGALDAVKRMAVDEKSKLGVEQKNVALDQGQQRIDQNKLANPAQWEPDPDNPGSLRPVAGGQFDPAYQQKLADAKRGPAPFSYQKQGNDIVVMQNGKEVDRIAGTAANAVRFQQAGNQIDAQGNSLGNGRFDPASGEFQVKGPDGVWMNLGPSSKKTSVTTGGYLNPQQYLKLKTDFNTEQNALRRLNGYFSTVQNFDVGLARMADEISGNVRTALGSRTLNPQELNRQVAQGQLQGLLGLFRTEIVGPGVMTEPDAQRIIDALGGDITTLQNPAVVKTLLSQIYQDKMSRVQLLKTELDRNAPAFGETGAPITQPPALGGKAGAAPAGGKPKFVIEKVE